MTTLTLDSPENPSSYKNEALAETAATVKTGAGLLVAIDIWNPSNAVAYVQVLDATTAVAGADASIVASFAVPTLSSLHVELKRPIHCRAASNPGIRVAACTTRLGNGAPSAALSVHVHYK